jgi:uncharacterized membrane protein YfcA
VEALSSDGLALLSGNEPLSAPALASLAVAALLTSMLSAVVGMAGGITLLGVMLLFQDPLVAIPLHGLVQLVSNGTRTWVQRAHVSRALAWRYALPLLPAAALGLFFARGLDPVLLKTAIGVFVLVATWRKEWLLFGLHPERVPMHLRFLVLGAVAGFLNMTVGATGPFIAPFFLDVGLTRFELIGTKAACQLMGHVSKVVVFGLGGFAFGAYAGLLALLCACVVVGTWLGSRLLHRVNERAFDLLYRGVLTLVALRLVATPFLAG